MRAIPEPLAHVAATTQLLILDCERFDGPYHHHAALEVTWIRDGAGVRVIDGQVSPFAAGDVVLVPPRVPHVWWSRGDGGGASALVLHLTLPPGLGLLPELKAARDCLAEGARSALLEGSLRAAAIADLQAIADSDGLERLGRALALVGRIANAEAGLVRQAPGARTAALPGEDPRLGRVLAWIHRDFDRPLTVAEGARRLSVAPGSFSRAFRRRAGRPFSAYLNDVRIAESCLLLRHSQRPIAEVARRCGFPTLGHFHRQLAKRTGLGPREYRRAFLDRP